ncbi:MAG TPA: hypothetical protein VF171_06315, partial [Trueperaceae bacterium]
MPKTVSHYVLLVVVPLLAWALAQGAPGTGGAGTGGAASQRAGANPSERIINIDYSGGSQHSESLRYGPIVFDHPNPEGIVGTVSNLTIYSNHAVLEAPEGVLIAKAEGQRRASFTGGVRVVRGRLTAKGPKLVYSEASGEGVMPEKTAIVVTPEQEGDDPVEIGTDRVTFDVDTDMSVSEGHVTLHNGPQSAEAGRLVFEEGRNLAKMATADGQVTARRKDEDGSELVITADVIRVLTDADRLLATGHVTIVDGAITSTGNTVFFDDEASRALILGKPAVSVDEANGTRTSGA